MKSTFLCATVMSDVRGADMATDKAQRLQVFGGIILAWALSAAVIVAGYWACRTSNLFADWTALESAAFAISMASVALIAGIGWAARTRHFISNIDGSRPEPGSGLDLTLRYVSNTTEQLVLFALGCLSLAAVDPGVATPLLPVMGVWFVIARILFIVGYRVDPIWRSVGFAATFHPTIALFALVFISFMT
jgi:uncharacterized membrane protein YecN with MAPEG domain